MTSHELRDIFAALPDTLVHVWDRHTQRWVDVESVSFSDSCPTLRLHSLVTSPWLEGNTPRPTRVVEDPDATQRR
jgi:hypothetical protein